MISAQAVGIGRSSHQPSLTSRCGSLDKKDFGATMSAMGDPCARHLQRVRPRSAETQDFRAAFVQDHLAGETLHSLARRHDLSRSPIRAFEAAAFDDEAAAAGPIEAYEARFAALTRSRKARFRQKSGAGPDSWLSSQSRQARASGQDRHRRAAVA